MNCCHFSGRLAADAVFRQKEEGKSVAIFTMAVRRFHPSDEVDFFRFLAFGKRAETIHTYVHKGDELIITECVAITKSWTDRQNVLHDEIEFIVNEFEFGRKAAEPKTPEKNPEPQFTEIDANAELPF